VERVDALHKNSEEEWKWLFTMFSDFYFLIYRSFSSVVDILPQRQSFQTGFFSSGGKI
jgi:hypothetical protein